MLKKWFFCLFPFLGLELSSLRDWTSELRPSMRKLRQAMDGLLKTARLTHSVFRLQEDKGAAQRACHVRYRRHVVFSHAVGYICLLFTLIIHGYFVKIILTFIYLGLNKKIIFNKL